MLYHGPAPNSYRLTKLRASEAGGGPALPDLTIRALPRLGRLQIDGLLRLDFSRRFDRVYYQLLAMPVELTSSGG